MLLSCYFEMYTITEWLIDPHRALGYTLHLGRVIYLSWHQDEPVKTKCWMLMMVI